ncbi:MAG: VanZ family protein [Clostridia bacterium]
MARNKKRRNIYLVLSITWFLLILFLSSQTADISSELSGGLTEKFLILLERIKLVEKNAHLDHNLVENFHSIIRKLAHMFEYFVLAIFTYNYLYYDSRKNNQIIIFSILTVILAASVDELFQTTIDGRAGQISDVLIDTSGGILAIFMSYYYKKLKARKFINS